MTKIGEKTLHKGGQMLTNLLLSYSTKINEAYKNSQGSGLKIGMSLTIWPGGSGQFSLKTEINFVLEKVTDSFTDTADELQTNLLDAIENLQPDEDSGIESVTISSGNKSVTLPKKKKAKDA